MSKSETGWGPALTSHLGKTMNHTICKYGYMLTVQILSRTHPYCWSNQCSENIMVPLQFEAWLNLGSHWEDQHHYVSRGPLLTFMIHCERVRQSTTHKLHICGSTGICCESLLVEGTSHPTEKTYPRHFDTKTPVDTVRFQEYLSNWLAKILSIINRPPKWTKQNQETWWVYHTKFLASRITLSSSSAQNRDCCITFPVDLLVQKPAWRIIPGWSKRLGWPPHFTREAIWKGNKPILRGLMIGIFINHLQVLGWSC